MIGISHWMRGVSAAAALIGASQLAFAAPLMPSFDNVPLGWTTDRYDPASFANVGAYQGRNDVLGIGINSSTDSANRGGQSGTFYNTQGKQHAISGGVGSVLAADVYIDSNWRDSANGYVRTDMWGVMTDPNPAVTAYPIIGFTNFGGAARLRVWDAESPLGWVDLGDAILFDDWNSLSVEFTGSSFDYYVNGSLAYSYSDATVNGSTQFAAVIMQAYNFNDPALGVAGNPAYTAHWANTLAAVPEPGSLALVGLALFSLGVSRRQKRAKV